MDASLQQFASSDVLPAIYVKLAATGLESLDAVERDRVRAWEFARFVRMRGQFHQFRLGLPDDLSYRDMLDHARRHSALWQALGLESADGQFLEAVRRTQ